MIQIPSRFKEASLLDWEEDTEVRALGMRYLENFDEHYKAGEAPLLVGRSGVGKSHLAAALLNTIRDHASVSMETAWLPASEYFNAIIDAKDLRFTDKYLKLLSMGKSSDIVVFDDISSLRNYPRLLEWFWIVLDHRYSEMKPSIITANFSVEDTSLWESIAEHTTVAISRRLHECSKNLTLVM